jgi:uncharacterized protein YcbX
VAVPQVAQISISPVKALRLVHPQSVRIEDIGVPENRLFLLIDQNDEVLDDADVPTLSGVSQSYEADSETLEITLPDGSFVRGDASDLGEEVEALMYGSRAVPLHVVRGHWAEALSFFVGRPVRLGRCVRPGDGNSDHPTSILSKASLLELAHRGSATELDGRRFRMMFTLSGCEPHEEDTWIGRRVRIGEAVVTPIGRVSRCRITTQDPDSGVKDFDTLKLIVSYRPLIKRDGKKDGIPFGVHAVIDSAGTVRVGDGVEPD